MANSLTLWKSVPALLRVAKEIKQEVKKATSMEELWEILNYEYGKAIDICCEDIKEFRAMVPSGRIDSHKFIELFRNDTQVKNNLVEFDRFRDLES